MTMNIDWAALVIEYESRLSPRRLRQLSTELGVTCDSLVSLHVGWSDAEEAWTFPEFNGQETIIGIIRRYPDGTKRAMPRSQRGLYLPSNWRTMDGTIYVPEGASDVAALLSHGIRAIGRPSCTGGRKHLTDLLAETDCDILVLGENDQKDCGHWPGRDGARALATHLAHDLGGRVRWTLPPDGAKDIRDYLLRRSDGR